MKKNLLFSLVGLTVLSIIISSYSNNPPPAGNTGSVGDGQNCGNSFCHNTAATIQNSMITTNIPGTGYLEGNTYGVTVTVNETGTSKFGFSMTGEDDGNTRRGAWITIDATTTESSGYIGHAAGAGTSSNTQVWKMQWTAPSSDKGVITFYAAAVAANNSGTNTGDQVFTSSTIAASDPLNSIGKINVEKSEIMVYPNPVVNTITINHRLNTGTVSIYNMAGAAVYKANMNLNSQKIDVSSLEKGTYIIRLQSKKETLIKRIYKI